jgi:glycosyltransferase involved in cell wall biosynthesis
VPDISVVIPTFNRADMLVQAVQSALAQRGVDLEVVVSDNASTDHTQDVLQQWAGDSRVRCFRNPSNIGMVGNWRLAIYERARAPWFVLLSDDDYFTDPSYLARAAHAMRTHAPMYVYAGGVVDDVALGRSTMRLPFDGLVPGSDVLAARGTLQPQDMTLCNMVFRVADARRLNFLSDPDNLSCDSELALMLCCEGDVFAVPEPVSVYRKHGANLVNSIMRSRRLMSHNLDHLVRPFAYARERGLPAVQIAAFRANSRIDDAVRTTLLKQWINNARWYHDCRARLMAVAPDLVREIEQPALYRATKLALALGRVAFRRRYPLFDTELPCP